MFQTRSTCDARKQACGFQIDSGQYLKCCSSKQFEVIGKPQSVTHATRKTETIVDESLFEFPRRTFQVWLKRFYKNQMRLKRIFNFSKIIYRSYPGPNAQDTRNHPVRHACCYRRSKIERDTVILYHSDRDYRQTIFEPVNYHRS